MPDETQAQRPVGLDPKWQLIQDRLKVKDLVEWLRQFRGERDRNPNWLSWDGIAREIFTRTKVTVTAQGVRNRFVDEVDEPAGDAGGAVLREAEAAAPPVRFSGTV